MTDLNFPAHTVEKIGGTSMSRLKELRDTLLIGDRKGADLYGRIFVVSAFGGITNLLLEHKKTGEPGVYASFANASEGHGWLEALDRVAEAMRAANHDILDHPADLSRADDFVRERIEGARSCLFDLQRLCSYGHFRLSRHMMVFRELLSGLGEAQSAFVASLLLNRAGVAARYVDLTGWRDERELTLDERLTAGITGIDLTAELPIVTGYAQCTEGLMAEFDRGYSEVTFSRMAALTNASEAIIHKEFHLSSADPGIVGQEAVRKLGHTNYDVADQLANLGMEAIHPKAAKTLRQKQIPLRVTNAFEPDDPGTLINDSFAETTGAEIVTGLPVVALEVFEQDMVGVKGYDSKILEVLTRHNAFIVSKTSNANTITHFLATPPKRARRIENELSELYPAAQVSARSAAIASAVGRNLTGQHTLMRGLQALAQAGINVEAAHQPTRAVDVQFLLDRDDLERAIKVLHADLIESEAAERIAA
ncbi:aspartate kinase [Paracoccus aerodenitrificans]|uniref:aspartate kinase n=1 Tax=Paracoccus aerodenitrificans TaxID=3017781 RepID=UPI0022F0C967|nr:aspartate kinase [Paracoccus aerodenitrificans]WBU63517.1 aspartate kinase [Paracoccus aerodenitrificans]